jgi:PAS domain S-box-containing protein
MTSPSAVPTTGEFWHALFEAYPDAVLLVDGSGRVNHANAAAASLLGYSIDELGRMNVDALVPDRLRAGHSAKREAYQQAPTRRPMGLQMELAALRRDGSEVMVEIALSAVVAGEQHSVLAAIRAVGEYPRVKQALRRTRLAECVALMGRLAVDSRDAESLLQEVPRAAAAALDATAAALFVLDHDGRRTQWVGGVGPVGAAPSAAQLAERGVLHGPSPLPGAATMLSVPVVGRGRTVGALEVHAPGDALLGADAERFLGSLASLVSTVLQREASEEAMRHSQRLESVGQLTGGIAHDFNNLLTVIQGNLQVLADLPTVADDNLAQDLVSAAARASHRGAELTAKLLAFSRRQHLQPRPIQLEAMLPPLAQLLRRTLDKRIHIELDVRRGCPVCLADPVHLESALLNIAINARDAMPDGGRLRISARVCAQAPAAADASAWSQGGVELAIEDSGVGMSEAVLARAFEPFFTTKETGRGTGLGLATVYGFARQSHGSVELASRVGEGTMVRLFLPSPADSALPAPERPREPAAPVPSGLSVLLVEDEPEVLRVVQAFLDHWDCRVTACRHAEAALDALADADARFDLLLSDVVLGPGLRGDQLAERARARHARLPVLLMSGYASALVVESDPRYPLLRKPFTREQLAQAIVEQMGAMR